MKLSIVIGRFQPLHDGHLTLIEEARKQGDKTLILVGSPNKLPDYKDPFSYEERKQFLEDSLETLDEIMDEFIIRPLNDEPSDDDWVANVIGEAISLEEDPTQVTIYTSKKDEAFYRKTFLFPVETVNILDISATMIRHAWYTDTLWTVEEYLPPSVTFDMADHEDFERLAAESLSVDSMALTKEEGHPFGNPMEPVSFAVILQGSELLVGRRGAPRGRGQLGLAGGYVEKNETTLEGCMREVREEMGVDLKHMITSGHAQCLAQAVEENLGDLGTRTLGVNYLFVINPEIELEIQVDGSETTEHKWLTTKDVYEDKELLFYNHNLVVKRLLSKLGDNK
tara:strand:+ start:1125 stop:2141 length:1017 start_codon:yes stop_codon:yes gene_type:complete